MKTTLNIDNRILSSARRYAKSEGITLAALVEDAILNRIGPLKATFDYQFTPVVVRGYKEPQVDVADRNALYRFLERG